MASVDLEQLPLPIKLGCVAGDDYGFTFTVEAPTVLSGLNAVVEEPNGSTVSGALAPTITTVGASTTVAWTAAKTAQLNTSPQSPRSYRVNVSAIIDGGGRRSLLAGPFLVIPPTQTR